jgi:hypothetical protein
MTALEDGQEDGGMTTQQGGFIHGVDCEKVHHAADDLHSYRHGEADDGPYHERGALYCGRCHRPFCVEVAAILRLKERAALEDSQAKERQITVLPLPQDKVERLQARVTYLRRVKAHAGSDVPARQEAVDEDQGSSLDEFRAALRLYEAAGHEGIASEREVNAILTQENAALQARVESLEAEVSHLTDELASRVSTLETELAEMGQTMARAPR